MTTFLKQSNFLMNHHGPLTQAGLIHFAHFRALKTCGSFLLSHQTMANWFSFLWIISHFELHVTGYVCSEYDNLSLTGMYLSKAGLGTCLNINLGFLKKVSTPFISTKLKTWRSVSIPPSPTPFTRSLYNMALYLGITRGPNPQTPIVPRLV